MGKYDPSKTYSWQPTDKFELTGEQFGLILNTLRGIINTPEAQNILMANRANEEIEKIVATAVEDGKMVEQGLTPIQPTFKVEKNEEPATQEEKGT